MPNSFMHHVNINGTNYELVDDKNRSDQYLLEKNYDTKTGGRMIFDSARYEPGRLNASGDVYYDASEDPAHFVSDYIPVYSGMNILTSFSIPDYHHRICEYGLNKNFIRMVPASSAQTFIIPDNVYYIRFCAYESERSSIEIKTPEVIAKSLSDINTMLGQNIDIIGSANLDKYNFHISDPDTSTEIGSSIGVEYTLPSKKFLADAVVNITPGTVQRLWFYCVIESSRFPSGIISNGLYVNNTKVSSNILSSFVYNNTFITLGYLDVSENDDYQLINVLFGYSYSATGVTIKMRKFDVLTTAQHQIDSVQYLDVGSGQQYPTFTSAFNYAKGRPYIDYAVRYFGNGSDYDISAENGNTDPNGLHIPRNIVEIIGSSERDMNIIADSYNNGTGSCFWIEYGTIIRNIYFKGTGKYCIHIDDPNNKRYDTVIENCRFYHASGGSGSIGIGFQAMCNITISNNLFERDTDAGVRVHNWDYSNQTAGILRIEGNTFKANAMACAVHLYTVSRNAFGYPIALIIGNDFNGLKVVLSEESYPSFGSGNHWRVCGRNNSDTIVDIKHHDDRNYADWVEMILQNVTVNDIKE